MRTQLSSLFPHPCLHNHCDGAGGVRVNFESCRLCTSLRGRGRVHSSLVGSSLVVSGRHRHHDLRVGLLLATLCAFVILNKRDGFGSYQARNTGVLPGNCPISDLGDYPGKSIGDCAGPGSRVICGIRARELNGKSIWNSRRSYCGAEQDRVTDEIDRRVSEIDNIEAGIELHLTRADRLHQSILKRAFEGKLVPQDPNDEPASVLLERIRAERATKAQPSKRTPQTRRTRSAGAEVL
jgi:hypothetical protein